jgi:hypothetical protein
MKVIIVVVVMTAWDAFTDTVWQDPNPNALCSCGRNSFFFAVMALENGA